MFVAVVGPSLATLNSQNPEIEGFVLVLAGAHMVPCQHNQIGIRLQPQSSAPQNPNHNLQHLSLESQVRSNHGDVQQRSSVSLITASTRARFVARNVGSLCLAICGVSCHRSLTIWISGYCGCFPFCHAGSPRCFLFCCGFVSSGTTEAGNTALRYKILALRHSFNPTIYQTLTVTQKGSMCPKE